ncbi:MAG: hypothetical protein ABSD98_08625 [Candidatus Korobacteraceae bacterium]|jgi:hypothetical protein
MQSEPAKAPVKKGIVVMIDALGARTFSTEASQRFLEARDRVLADCEATRALLRSMATSDTELVTFGDTIILCWPLRETATDEVFLPALAEWLRKVMLSGFHHGMLFRGAIAVGEYIQTGATVLGPAVADAAVWYDRADWMGIIATPNCGLRLSFLKERIEASTERLDDATPLLGSWYVEYPVPFKDGTQRILWALSWPAQYLFDSHNPKGPKKAGRKKLPVFNGSELFRFHISRFPVPAGTEGKFSNTTSFFEWFRKSVKLGPPDD